MNEEKGKAVWLVFGVFWLLFFSLGPLVFMVLTSLSKDPLFLTASKSFSADLSHYLAVIRDPTLHFFAYMRNSLLVAAASACGSVLIASLAAYALTRLRFKGKKGLLLAALGLSMFPQISLMGYLFRLMADLGWINTYWALIPPYIAWILPLTFWILTGYFSQIQAELDEAAMIDGCSRWQVLSRIVFPVALPGLFSAWLLSFIAAFNEFMFALMLTSDFRARTLPVGIAFFEGLHGQIPWGQIMAAATLSILPIILLVVFFQHRIVQGLTQGSVKS